MISLYIDSCSLRHSALGLSQISPFGLRSPLLGVRPCCHRVTLTRIRDPRSAPQVHLHTGCALCSRDLAWNQAAPAKRLRRTCLASTQPGYPISRSSTTAVMPRSRYLAGIGRERWRRSAPRTPPSSATRSPRCARCISTSTTARLQTPHISAPRTVCPLRCCVRGDCSRWGSRSRRERTRRSSALAIGTASRSAKELLTGSSRDRVRGAFRACRAAVAPPNAPYSPTFCASPLIRGAWISADVVWLLPPLHRLTIIVSSSSLQHGIILVAEPSPTVLLPSLAETQPSLMVTSSLTRLLQTVHIATACFSSLRR